jgi:DNA polymerase elongation subunit (family B)
MAERKIWTDQKRTVISDLLELIKSYDPDLILLPYADIWIPLMVRKARRYGLR